MMSQIKGTFSTAVFVFGLTVCLNSPARAQKKAYPGGSYQQTCSNIQVINATTIKAYCLTKSEGADPSWLSKITGAGKEFTAGHPDTTLDDYFLCVGDISNNDGNLTCQKSQNSPPLKAAKKAIDNGLANALGLKPVSNEEYLMWIRQMFNAGMDADFYKGWNSVETAMFYKNYLAKPQNASLRASVIEQAMKAVTGFPATPERQAFYDAEIKNNKIGYTEIVMLETDRQNSNQISRKLIIMRAYKDALGRIPTTAEQNYWTPRKENYNQLVAAHRNWLYSAQGAKDLTETVKRALTDKYSKKSVNDEDVKKAIMQYAPSKKIYDEM